jgi:hypothetical protein
VHYVGHYTISFQNARSLQHKIWHYQTFSLHFKNIYNHITYGRTPTTVNVSEEVITLHIRSVVSRAVTTPWRHQQYTQL